MANRRPGYCFTTDPANNLQSSFRALSRRGFAPTGPLSLKGSGRQRVLEYLRGRDSLVQLLFAAIHSTSGMPARGEELRLIRWANTPAAPRNIFVHNGMVILVFSYNKATTNHNNSFYIVRRPCPTVERILFTYLAYVRPFSDFLFRELSENYSTSPNRHLFTWHDWDSACFNSDACLRCLQKSTTDSPTPITMRRYRHIAIALSKKHLPALVKPFDAHTPRDYDGFLQLLAFQTGHKPSTHTSAYALETAFPAKLQPDLIRRYLENSRVWHEFLLIGQEDVIEAAIDQSYNALDRSFKPAGYFPDPPKKARLEMRDEEENGWTSDEIDLTSRFKSHRAHANSRNVTSNEAKRLKRKGTLCVTDEDLSPISKKIRQLEDNIETLLEQK